MYVILVTGYYSVGSAIEAVKRGAYGYQPLGSVQPVSMAPAPSVLGSTGPGGR